MTALHPLAADVAADVLALAYKSDAITRPAWEDSATRSAVELLTFEPEDVLADLAELIEPWDDRDDVLADAFAGMVARFVDDVAAWLPDGYEVVRTETGAWDIVGAPVPDGE
ncbi:hypothetical protein [Mycolicibacterium phlei]|uniref:hypothetical protein n=1 Tax=Mycolicibacterium phlei TaxID=1771 RepID=UPI0002D27CD9|nr:hypothetical protein [Mycolicibacterium phlei]MBF4194652.1 hypothetical protein [Mycolicibacterium phlei]